MRHRRSRIHEWIDLVNLNIPPVYQFSSFENQTTVKATHACTTDRPPWYEEGGRLM